MVVSGADGARAIEALNREHKGQHAGICLIHLNGETDHEMAGAMGDAAARGANTIDGELLSMRMLDDGNFRMQFRNGPPVDSQRVVFAANLGTPLPTLEFPRNQPIKSETGWEIPGKDASHGIRFEGGLAQGLDRRTSLQQIREHRQAQLESLDNRWEGLKQLREQKKQIKAELRRLDTAHTEEDKSRWHNPRLQNNELDHRLSADFQTYFEEVDRYDAEEPMASLNQEAFEVLDFCSSLAPANAVIFQKFINELHDGKPGEPFGIKQKIPPDIAASVASDVVNRIAFVNILDSDKSIDEKCALLEYLHVSPEQIATFRREVSLTGFPAPETRERMGMDVYNFFQASRVFSERPRDTAELFQIK